VGPVTAPAPAPPVTIAWVASPGAPAPSAAAERSLAAWAEARGVRLAVPSEAPLPPIHPSPALAEAVEAELDRAKDAITSQDGALADASLRRAEGVLRLHPELPQAAWLLAEVWRARASRYRLLAPHDNSVTLDGIPTSTRLSAPPGDHQVRVAYDGTLVWAGWVPLGQGPLARVSLPRATPCSRADLGRSRFQGERAIANDVTCGEWVLVAEDKTVPDELALAVCSGEACGPVLRWHVGPLSPIVPDWRARAQPWPPWATWAVVGASVLVVTGATLAATGVFRPTHDEASFTTGGVHVAAGVGELERMSAHRLRDRSRVIRLREWQKLPPSTSMSS